MKKKSRVESVIEDLENNIPFDEILKKYPGLTIKSLGEIIKYKVVETKNDLENLLDVVDAVKKELKKN